MHDSRLILLCSFSFSYQPRSKASHPPHSASSHRILNFREGGLPTAADEAAAERKKVRESVRKVPFCDYIRTRAYFSLHLLQAMRQQWASDKASHAAAAAAAVVVAAAAAASNRDSDSTAPNVSEEISAAFPPPFRRVPVLSLPAQPPPPQALESSRLHR